ncbi:MAG TPA: VCBS repeat-containing protein [Gemmatimonadales bacterium]|nr:VCBS repeat-containing protein [Gemmatimonadales bacterium]
MPLTPRLALAAALLAACAQPQAVGVSSPAAPASGWQREVAPFPVFDSAGARLELPFLGGYNTPRPQLLDVDGDGDLDLLVQEYSNRLTLLANEGPGPRGVPRFTFVSDHWAGLDVGEWSRFLDVNGDGRLDAFAELPFSHIRLWTRGPGATPAFAPGDSVRDTEGRAIFADRQNIPQFVDLDCDGRLDLLIGRVQGTILRYEAERREGTPSFRLVDERFQDLEIITGQGSRHGANTMAFADVDGDGDLDLVWGDFFEPGLLLFENTGRCEEPLLRKEPVGFPVTAPVRTSGYNAPAFGDVDRDGHLDFVVGVVGGSYDPNRTTIANLLYYAGTPGHGFAARTDRLLSQVDVGSESLPVLADLDGDGDLDLLVGNKLEPLEKGTSRLWRFENVGSRSAPQFRWRGALPLRGRYHMAPAAGDLDGDGDADLLVGSFSSRVALARNDGGAFTIIDSALVTIPRGSNTTPALGDLDGDGDLDLLVGEASGSLNYYRNDGSRTAPAFTLVSETFDDIKVGRRSAPHLADVDGDGDLDLLVGTDEGGLATFRNEGSRAVWRFVREAGITTEVPPMSAPAAGDLDGDGRMELVVGNSGGGLLFLRRR